MNATQIASSATARGRSHRTVNTPACITVLSVLFLNLPAVCQRGPTPYYEDTKNVPVSPEIHPDRTVTFRLFAPKASEVILMGSPGILEVIKEPKPLRKDDKGVWSLTV